MRIVFRTVLKVIGLLPTAIVFSVAASSRAATNQPRARVAVEPLSLVCHGPLPPREITHDHLGRFDTLAIFCRSEGPFCQCLSRQWPPPVELVCFEELFIQPVQHDFDAAINYCLDHCWCQDRIGRQWHPPPAPQQAHNVPNPAAARLHSAAQLEDSSSSSRSGDTTS